MKLLNCFQTMQINGGVAENVAKCEDGYLKASLYIPPHSTEKTIGVVIGLEGTPIYKKMEHSLPNS